MMTSFMQELALYFSSNWVNLLTWLLLIGVLYCVKLYQKKWIITKKEYIEAQHVITIQAIQNSPVEINLTELRTLRNQCNSLEELITATNRKLDPSSSVIDKEVVELMCQIGAQSKVRTQNVE